MSVDRNERKSKHRVLRFPTLRYWEEEEKASQEPEKTGSWIRRGQERMESLKTSEKGL